LVHSQTELRTRIKGEVIPIELPQDDASSLGTFEEESDQAGFKAIPFRADAALIRELGERLVGAPHIALAELVKNAYDADATKCVIWLGPTRITVSDNGHGMTDDEFSSLWMTIGSTHKRARRYSSEFRRPVTGSKGVGRLAAQFLAHKLQMFTKSAAEENAVHVLVDWDQTAIADGLTEAKARYRKESASRIQFPDDSKTGTAVVLERLNQRWDADQVQDLGREIWKLNSPFPRFGAVASGRRADAFEIVFQSSLPGYDKQFASQMSAALENWDAKIDGELHREGDKSRSTVTITFADGDKYEETFSHPPLIAKANWQIRVYRLIGRQAGGISVYDAREYFKRFGVMLFDSGFRLPYYGTESDWLAIDRDHALRLSQSRLLPAHLQEDRGLNDLPQQGRLIGVVSVDTGNERAEATEKQRETNDYLQILVTRDRLVANDTFLSLRNAVRQSLDFYATRQRAREAKKDLFERAIEPPIASLHRIERLVQQVADRFPFDEYAANLKHEFRSFDAGIEQQQRADDAARALLGPLAAAGMAALAMEHENRREIITGREIVLRLREALTGDLSGDLGEAVEDLDKWIDRLEASRRVFAPLLEEDGREQAGRLKIRGVLREVAKSLKVLMPRVEIDILVPPSMYLPPATYAEWHALFQNVLTNAGNAMLDVAKPRIGITAHSEGSRYRIHVNDIGVGIELSTQRKMFEPFGREQRISEERAALGLGGMGLGLTIVRMIADQRGCSARFTQPEDGWNTTFELEWTADDNENANL